MCFASGFLWFILVFPLLEGRGEKYPNIASGQLQLKCWTVVVHTSFMERPVLIKGTFLSDMQVPIALEATQLFIFYLSNMFLFSPAMCINQEKKLMEIFL